MSNSFPQRQFWHRGDGYGYGGGDIGAGAGGGGGDCVGEVVGVVVEVVRYK